jgi:hypothetical protein
VALFPHLQKIYAPTAGRIPRELVARLQQVESQHEFLYLDPRWVIERMIAALTRLPAPDIGPFPT